MKLKCLWFDSQMGHVPGLGARLPVAEAHERQPHTDVSLPLFFPPFLSVKINLKKKHRPAAPPSVHLLVDSCTNQGWNPQPDDAPTEYSARALLPIFKDFTYF